MVLSSASERFFRSNRVRLLQTKQPIVAAPQPAMHPPVSRLCGQSADRRKWRVSSRPSLNPACRVNDRFRFDG